MCFVVVIMLQPGHTSPEAVCPALALFHIILTALNFQRESVYRFTTYITSVIDEGFSVTK